MYQFHANPNPSDMEDVVCYFRGSFYYCAKTKNLGQLAGELFAAKKPSNFSQRAD